MPVIESTLELDSPLPMFTKHPVLPAVTHRELLQWQEELGDERAAKKLSEVHAIYEQTVFNERDDPHRYGLELEPWKDADRLLGERDELHVLGGNRSSKSTWAGDRVVRAALYNRGSYILCWSQNPRTKNAQMQIVWERLPKEFRKKLRGEGVDVSYSPKVGFTRDSLIINHSKIEFWCYTQYLQDNSCIEGLKLGSPQKDDSEYYNIGNWFDEYLLGPELLETMRFRLATYNSKNICTFTPVKGLSDTLQKLRKGAKVIEEKPCPLLSTRQTIPYIEQPAKTNSAVIYFHSSMNPYGGYKRLSEDLQGEPDGEKAIRAYGFAVNQRSSKFPKFSRAANVVKHTDLPFVRDKNFSVTRYMCIDPAGVRSWSMLWAAVDAANNVYIYREWPDRSYGHWGEWGKSNRDGIQKSRPGSAQTHPQATGIGYQGLADLIDELEDGEKIDTRYIDPRAASSPQKKENYMSDIQTELLGVGVACKPAPGNLCLREDDGLQLIQDRLDYNIEKPLDHHNTPTLFVSDACENFIECMQEYTASEGMSEAWKDFIDLIRYMLLAKIDYLDVSVYGDNAILPQEPVY